MLLSPFRFSNTKSSHRVAKKLDAVHRPLLFIQPRDGPVHSTSFDLGALLSYRGVAYFQHLARFLLLFLLATWVCNDVAPVLRVDVLGCSPQRAVQILTCVVAIRLQLHLVHRFRDHHILCDCDGLKKSANLKGFGLLQGQSHPEASIARVKGDARQGIVEGDITPLAVEGDITPLAGWRIVE